MPCHAKTALVQKFLALYTRQIQYFGYITVKSQSIENAGVAFVKGTNESMSTEFFEKINKQ